MKKIFLTAVIILVSVTGAYSQIPAMTFEEFQPLLNTNSDSVFVVNFWATWCLPCVKELPEFEKLNDIYSDKQVKVILVSLDNPIHMESRIMPFIKKHDLQSEIILLDDPRSNQWIPRVDDSWSGSIPATIIFTKDKRSFYEQVFTYSELEDIVKSKLN